MAIANVDSFIKIFKFYQDNPLLQVRENFKENALKYEDTVDVYLNSLTFDRQNSLAYDTDDDTIQTALNAREKVAVYFDKVLYPGSYSFNTIDNSNFRKMLLDWTSTIKTIQDSAKKVTDAYSLSSDDVDKAMRGFGVDFVNQHTLKSINRRKNYLLSICDLYSIKGSPQSIIKALSVIGLSNIFIREGWIEAINNGTDLDINWKAQELDQEFDEDNNAWKESEAIEDSIKSWDWFLDKIEGNKLDPHWMYSKEDILKLHNSDDVYLKLPSITPYFGIEFKTDADKQIDTYETLQSELNLQLQKYLSGNLSDSDKSIWFGDYQSKLSILECYTSLVYSLIRLDDHLLYANFKSYLESCGFNPPTFEYPCEYFKLIYWFYLNYKDKNTFKQVLNDFIPIKSSDYCSYNQVLSWWLNAQYNSIDNNTIRVTSLNQISNTKSKQTLLRDVNDWTFTRTLIITVNKATTYHSNKETALAVIDAAHENDVICYRNIFGDVIYSTKDDMPSVINDWKFTNIFFLSVNDIVYKLYTKDEALAKINLLNPTDIATHIEDVIVDEICDVNRATIIVSQLANSIIDETEVLKEVTVNLVIDGDIFTSLKKSEALARIKNVTDSVISESHIINVEYVRPDKIIDTTEDGKPISIYNNAIHLGWKQDYPFGRFSVEEFTEEYGWREVLSNQVAYDTNMSVFVDTDMADGKDSNIDNFRIVLYHTANNIPDIFFEAPFNLNGNPTDTMLDRIIRYNGPSTSLSYYDDDKIKKVFYDDSIASLTSTFNIISEYHRHETGIYSTVSEYHKNQTCDFDVRPTDIQYELFSYYASAYNYPNHTKLYEDKWMNLNSSFSDYVDWSTKLYFDTITHNGLLENNENIEYLSNDTYRFKKFPLNSKWNWAVDSKYYYICYEKNKWCRIKYDSIQKGSPSELFDGNVNDSISYGSTFVKQDATTGNCVIFVYVSYNTFITIYNNTEHTVENDWISIDCDLTSTGTIKVGSKLSRDLAVGCIKDETILELIRSDFTLDSRDDARSAAVSILNSSIIEVYKQPYDNTTATQYNYQTLLEYLYNARLTLDYTTGYIYPKYSYYKDSGNKLYIKCKYDTSTTDTKWLRVEVETKWETLDSDCVSIFDTDNDVKITQNDPLIEDSPSITTSYTIEQALRKLNKDKNGQIIVFHGTINQKTDEKLLTLSELKVAIEDHIRSYPTDEIWILYNGKEYQFKSVDDAKTKIDLLINYVYTIEHNGQIVEKNRNDAITFVTAKNNGFLYPKYSFSDRYASTKFLSGPVFETHNHLIEAFNNGQIDDEIYSVLVLPYKNYERKISSAYENYVKIQIEGSTSEQAALEADLQNILKYKEEDEQYQNDYPVVYIKRPVASTECVPSYEWIIAKEDYFKRTNLGINPQFLKYLEDKYAQDEQNLVDIPNELTEVISDYVSEKLGISETVFDLTVANWTTNGLVKKIINFYKPKRARLLFMSNVIEGDYGITNNLDDIMVCDSDFNYYDLSNYRWKNPDFTCKEYSSMNKIRINQVIDDYIPYDDTYVSKPSYYNEVTCQREIFDSQSNIPQLEVYDQLLNLKNQVLTTNDTDESKVAASFYVSGFSIESTMNGFYFKLPGKDLYTNNVYYFEKCIFSTLSSDGRLGATTRWALFNAKVTNADRYSAIYVSKFESDYPWKTSVNEKMPYAEVVSNVAYVNDKSYVYKDVGFDDNDVIKVGLRILEPVVYFRDFADNRCNGFYYQDDKLHPDKNGFPVYFNQRGKIITYLEVDNYNITGTKIETLSTKSKLWIICNNKQIIDFVDADYYTFIETNSSNIWDANNSDFTKPFFKNVFDNSGSYINTISRVNEAKNSAEIKNYNVGISIPYLSENPENINKEDTVEDIRLDKDGDFRKVSFNQIALKYNPIYYSNIQNCEVKEYYENPENKWVNYNGCLKHNFDYTIDQEGSLNSALKITSKTNNIVYDLTEMITNHTEWSVALVCKFGDRDTITDTLTNSGDIPLNTWLTITITKGNSGLCETYINGIKKDCIFTSFSDKKITFNSSKSTLNVNISEFAIWNYALDPKYVVIISNYRILRNRPNVSRDKNITGPNNYRPLFVKSSPRTVYGRWDTGLPENIKGGRFDGYNADKTGMRFQDNNPLWDSFNYDNPGIINGYYDKETETYKKPTQSIFSVNGFIRNQENRLPINDGTTEISDSNYIYGDYVPVWWLRNNKDYKTGPIHSQPVYISLQEKLDDIYPVIKNGDDLEGNYFDTNRYFDGIENQDRSIVKGLISEDYPNQRFYNDYDYDTNTGFRLTTNENYPVDTFVANNEWPKSKPANWIWSKTVTKTINFGGDGINGAIPTNEIADTTQQIAEPAILQSNWIQNSLKYCRSVYPYHVYVNADTGRIINPFDSYQNNSNWNTLNNPGSTYVDKYSSKSNIVPDLEQYNLDEEYFLNGIFHSRLHIDNATGDYSALNGIWRIKDTVDSYKDGDFKKCYVLSGELETLNVNPTIVNPEKMSIAEFAKVENIDPFAKKDSEAVLNYHKENGLYWWEIRSKQNNQWNTLLRTLVKPEFNHSRNMIDYDYTNRNQLDLCSQTLCVYKSTDVKDFCNYNWINVTQQKVPFGFSMGTWIEFDIENDIDTTEATSNYFDGRFYHMIDSNGHWTRTRAEMIYPEHVYDDKEVDLPPPEVPEIDITGTMTSEELSTRVPNIIEPEPETEEELDEKIDLLTIYDVASKLNELVTAMNYETSSHPVSKLNPDEASIYECAINQNIIIDHHSSDFEIGKTVDRIPDPEDASLYDICYTMYKIMWAIGSKATIAAAEIFITEMSDITYIRLCKDMVFKFGKSTPSGFLYRDNYLYVSLGKTPDFSMSGATILYNQNGEDYGCRYNQQAPNKWIRIPVLEVVDNTKKELYNQWSIHNILNNSKAVMNVIDSTEVDEFEMSIIDPETISMIETAVKLQKFNGLPYYNSLDHMGEDVNYPELVNNDVSKAEISVKDCVEVKVYHYSVDNTHGTYYKLQKHYPSEMLKKPVRIKFSKNSTEEGWDNIGGTNKYSKQLLTNIKKYGRI